MKLASLWIGDRLGPIEILSAQSFLAAGNELTIFAYGPLADVPEGVEVRDAEPVLSGEKILRYPFHGWPSLHSNLFRYAIIATGEYVWVDLDVLALKAFRFDTPYVFGWENETSVNGAVLGLPPASPALAEFLKYKVDTIGFPPVMTTWQKRKLWLRSLGRGTEIEKWGHAAIGPKAVTHFLTKSGEIAHAMPREAFYPVPWEDTSKLVAPGAIDPDAMPPESYGVHLWGFQIKRAIKWRRGGTIPPDSFVGAHAARLGSPKLRQVSP